LSEQPATTYRGAFIFCKTTYPNSKKSKFATGRKQIALTSVNGDHETRSTATPCHVLGLWVFNVGRRLPLAHRNNDVARSDPFEECREIQINNDRRMQNACPPLLKGRRDQI
jgi:hypothetical protein